MKRREQGHIQNPNTFHGSSCSVVVGSTVCRVHHLLSSHGEGGVEPLLESRAALEDGRQEEVEQGPELRQLVLQRGAREQHAAWSQVVRVQHLGELTVVVLHPMALVHDHVLPTELREETQDV